MFKASTSSGERRAIKFVDGRRVEKRSFEAEVEALSKLRGTDGVVQLHEHCWVENADVGVLSLEFASGGDLYDHLIEHFPNGMDEPALRIVARRVLSSLSACHAAGIMHNDLKPENVLLLSAGSSSSSRRAAVVNGVLELARERASSPMDDDEVARIRRTTILIASSDDEYDDDDDNDDDVDEPQPRSRKRVRRNGDAAPTITPEAMSAAQYVLRRGGSVERAVNAALARDRAVRPLYGAALCDFGLCEMRRHQDQDRDQHQPPQQRGGTLRYRAPEVHQGMLRDRSSDVWSVGIMMFVLSMGAFPWEDPWSDKYCSYIEKDREGGAASLCFLQSFMGGRVSRPCVDFVHSMLRETPSHRLSVEKLAQHEWLQFGSP